MRTHAVLVTTCLAGTAALGGCADIPFTDDTFTLSNAASMRVEVEVYKGPLSKTLPVQWGELEGLVDTAVVLLGDIGEVICRTIDQKNSKSTGNGEDRNSFSSECGNNSDTAISAHRSTDVGDQILRGMHADAQRLMDEAKGLREVVRRTRPGSPACHVNQALEALAGSTIGPCSVSAAHTANKSANEAIDDAAKALQNVEGAVEAIDKGENKVRDAAVAATTLAEVAQSTIESAETNLKVAVGAIGDSESKVRERAAAAETDVMRVWTSIDAAKSKLKEVRDAARSVAEGNEKVRGTAATLGASVNIVKESIAGAETHLEAALDAAENVRKAAGKANESVLNAKVRTEDARNYVRRRSLVDGAKAAGDTLEKRMIDLAGRLDGLRNAIVHAGDYATQVEVPGSDASAPSDTLAEFDETLREAKNLAEASKQAHSAQTEAFNKWRTALGKFDDPAAKFISDEASGLASLASSSAPSLESARRTVNEIASEVESMQADATETYPLDALKVHLANARDHGLRLKEAKLGDPIQGIQNALSDAKKHLNRILSTDDDTKTVREVAGLTKEETALPADITKPLDTYHADAAVLRVLRHDDLEATLSSLVKARSAASELAMAGLQRALISLTAQLDQVLNQAARLRRVPVEDKIEQYVKSLERAGMRLRAGTANKERVLLDTPVKDNREALFVLYKALDEADGHLAVVVGNPRVPSPETRTQLHADLVKLVGLAEKSSLKSLSKLLDASTRTRAAAWRRRLVAAANGLERNLATIAELRTRVAGIDNKVGLLAAQIEKHRPSLNRAVTALDSAQTKTERLSKAANQGIPATPWEDAAREHVIRRIGDLGMKLKAKAFYWAEIHTALAPCCRDVRIAMAGFTNLASELSNHLESRADALQWQLDEEYGTDARELPLSLYLRDAQPTDFLNLYTWNRAAAPALVPDMFWHPLNAFSSDETADRVRVIDGTDQNAAIHLYTHERACPEARSARGRGCPMTRGRGSARGLVQCRRGRTAEQREPVVDPVSGQALVSAGPLVPSPAPGAQIEPGTEQVEKALSGALVDVEIGAQCRIEPLDGARGAMALVQHRLDGLEQRCAHRAKSVLQCPVGGEQMTIQRTMPGARRTLVQRPDQVPADARQAHRLRRPRLGQRLEPGQHALLRQHQPRRPVAQVLRERAIVKSGVRRVGHAAALLSSMSSIPSLNLTPSMSFASWRNPRSRRQDFSAHRPIL